MRKLFKRITALVLTAAVAISAECGGVRIHGVSPDVKVSKAAETQGRYVSDIRVSHAATKEEAGKELGEDYTVLDKDFNEGMGSHSWIGYSTTDDADLAITDIKLQRMNGDFSESDYQTLLDNHKETMNVQTYTVIPAIIEYAKNYDLGMKMALNVHRVLNVYREDDSEKNMGDLLYELGKALGADRNDKNAREILEKIFIEGNNAVITAIEDILTKATDTKLVGKGSWLTRMSVLGTDGLYNVYKQAYPGKARSYLKKMMENDLGEDAKSLLAELVRFREIIKEAESSELAKAAGDEAAVEQMVDELMDAEPAEIPLDSDGEALLEAQYEEIDYATDIMEMNTQAVQLVVAGVLKNTSYGGKSMYDFFMDEALEKSDLYTMAYVLSDGQKSIIKEIGVYPIFESVLAEYTEEDGELSEEDVQYMGEGMFSVYDGVDRSVFAGDTAITGATLKSMETKQDNDLLSPEQEEHLFIAAGAAITGVFLGAQAIRSFGTKVVWKEVPEVMTVPRPVTPAIEAIQERIFYMREYNNAWKLHYIEQKYPLYIVEPGDSLKSIQAMDKSVGRAVKIEQAYQRALENLRSFGHADAADKVMRWGDATKLDYIQRYENKVADKLYMKEKGTKSVSSKVPRASWGAKILYTLGALAAFAFAGYEIYCMTKTSAPIQFTKIPGKMVYRTYEGDISYITYHVAGDASGVPVDLHDKKGQQWLAIYTTTNSKVGDPILASSLYVREDTAVSDPDEKAFSFFDEQYPSNIADKSLTGKDLKGAYIYYKTGTEEPEEVADASEETEVSTEETAAPTAVETAAPAEDNAPEESSVFAWSGMLWILLIILVVAGGAAGAGVYYRKRKK